MRIENKPNANRPILEPNANSAHGQNAIKQRCLLEAMADAVFGKMGTFLNAEDRKRLSLVNRNTLYQRTPCVITQLKGELSKEIDTIFNFICKKSKGNKQERAKIRKELHEMVKLVAFLNTRQMQEQIRGKLLRYFISEFSTLKLSPNEDMGINHLKQVVKDAIETFGKLQLAITKPNSWGHYNVSVVIPKALCEQSRFAEALEIANLSPSVKQKWAAFGKIIEAMCQKGKIDEALALAFQMPQTTTTSHYLERSAIALSNRSQFDEALKISNAIPIRTERLYVQKLIDEAKNINLREQQKSLKVLLEKQCYSQAIKKTNALSGYHRVFALKDIAVDLCAHRRYQEAIRVAQSIPDSYHKSCSLIDVTRALCTARRFGEALQVAERIPVEYLKSHALRSIADAQRNIIQPPRDII